MINVDIYIDIYLLISRHNQLLFEQEYKEIEKKTVKIGIFGGFNYITFQCWRFLLSERKTSVCYWVRLSSLGEIIFTD